MTFMWNYREGQVAIIVIISERYYFMIMIRDNINSLINYVDLIVITISLNVGKN